LLAIYAHPDDEAFGAAGTFATFTDRGGAVTLVCATRGEAGEISDPALSTPDRLGAVREAELHAAMSHLGVSDIRFLDYRDSGMAGTDENANPANFVNADNETVVNTLVGIMREIEPDIVLTFGVDGVYGHPDHIKAHHTATEATRRYAAERGGAGPALYYNAVPRERIQAMAERTTGPFVGMTPEQIAQLGTPSALITTVLDITPQYDRKLAAVMAHKTQISPKGPWNDLPPEQVRAFLTTERFRLTEQPWSKPGVDPLRDIVGSPEPRP
jgi:N-acetyl-1-D-myo-inositol-2-amino-2-deoxy-alpha-D-glucopyranoside deacetylase